MKKLIPLLLMLALPAGAAYIALEDMRAGLDARKGVASAPAGTLREALNGHITPGGEFEKRKAFVQTSLPSGTYGLEAITNGLVTFGSDADPGGWPRGQVVQYQRLQHPAVLEGATYNATYHNLTGIVWSVCHEGLPFAAAAFSDGRQFLYYNGTLVRHSRSGQIMDGWVTRTNAAHDFTLTVADSIPTWSTYEWYNPTFFTDGYGAFFWNPGKTFTAVYDIHSTTGKFSHYDSSLVTGQTPGFVKLDLTNVFAEYSVYAKLTPTATEWTTLTYRAGATSTNVALGINMRSNYTAFTAVASNTSIYVYAPVYQPAAIDFFTNYTWPQLLATNFFDPGFTGLKTFSQSSIYKSATDSAEAVFTFWDNWTPGDKWKITIVASDGNTYTLGAGNISGKNPLSGFSHKNRVYLTLSNEFGFSSITDPMKFEDQDTGAGVVTFSSTFGSLDTVEGIGEYQGGIAVAGKLTTQLWNTDPDPADFYLRQTLPIGTVSGQTIQALGKLDTLMLSDSGVRSLRVRDSSGNAIVEDVGTPIDSFVQAALAGLTPAQKRTACATVDPASGRYWVYIPGNYIYVFSFHPLSGISAWTRYAPTFIQSATNTWFAPQKFTVYAGQIFARSTNAVYAYGGTGGTNYDACTMVAETPFLNGNTPGTYKSYGGLDLISEGIWTAKLGANLASDQSYVTVINGATNSTVTTGRPGLAARATHFKVRLEESGTGYARLSSVLLYYQPGDSR